MKTNLRRVSILLLLFQNRKTFFPFVVGKGEHKNGNGDGRNETKERRIKEIKEVGSATCFFLFLLFPGERFTESGSSEERQKTLCVARPFFYSFEQKERERKLKEE